MDNSRNAIAFKQIQKDVIFCKCGLPLKIDGTCKREHKSKNAKRDRFSGKSRRMYGKYEDY